MNPSGEAGSCHAAPDNATYAGFRKESRMKFADATKLDRKYQQMHQAHLQL
jgi:hypothetical protein